MSLSFGHDSHSSSPSQSREQSVGKVFGRCPEAAPEEGAVGAAPQGDEAPLDLGVPHGASREREGRVSSWIMGDLRRALIQTEAAFAATATLLTVLDEYEEALEAMAEISGRLERAGMRAAGRDGATDLMLELGEQLRNELEKCVDPVYLRAAVRKAEIAELRLNEVLATEADAPMRLGSRVVRVRFSQ